jgi:hypothetical protein
MNKLVLLIFLTLFGGIFELLERWIEKDNKNHFYYLKDFIPHDLNYWSDNCEKAHDKIIDNIGLCKFLPKEEKDIIELMLHITYSGTLEESKKNSDRFNRGEIPIDYPKIKCFTYDYLYVVRRLHEYYAILLVILYLVYISSIIFKIIYFLAPHFIKIIPA